MAEPFVSTSCTVFRTNRKLVGIGLLVALMGAVVLGVGIALSVPWAGVGLYPLSLGLLTAHAIGRVGLIPAREVGELTATPDGIRLDGREVVARASIGRGLLRVVNGAEPRVRCLDHHGQKVIDIEVPSAEEGAALRAAARLDGAHGVLVVRLTPELFGRTWVTVLLTCVPAVGLTAVMAGMGWLLEWFGVASGSVAYVCVSAGTAVAALLAGVGAWRWSRTVLRIGPDGVHVRTFVRKYFISYPEVRSVDRWPKPVVKGVEGPSEGFDLVLRSGRRFRLRTRLNRMLHGDVSGDDYIAVDIERGIAAHAERGALGELPVAAPTEPLGEWMDGIRKEAGNSEAGYRHPTWPRASSWLVLEDPGAPPLERAASAIALSGTGAGGNDRRRLRMAALAIASPALRDCVVAAADDADVAAERAVRALVAASPESA